jgi:hypothetical protein
MNIQDIINNIAAGENLVAKEGLENALSAKAFDALQGYKQEIAATLYGGQEQESEEDTDYEEDEEGAYAEGVEYDEDQEQLDEISTKTLASAAHAASDPDADYAYGMKKSMKHDPQKYADHAKKTKDAKSAAAVQGAADAKGHFPRPGHSFGGYDKLKSRENRSTNPSMVTKAGKLSKTSVKGLKSSLKEDEQLDEVSLDVARKVYKQRAGGVVGTVDTKNRTTAQDKAQQERSKKIIDSRFGKKGKAMTHKVDTEHDYYQ